ncbi:MAG: hypothetical protein HXX12_10015 [Geothrix sp.]|uniref:hypothetical protein n=1 Tax=Geothrix sp. TaxID=1962974 RepID=UPI001832262F|nr:hypothetical protein [Geothrix sp.]NWJ41294.1 hypothetical protein [Geothrix sp.]WIL20716.1 MAG: hypothetical protein QOZ81_003301 [Geothrix sp.]
MTNDVQHLKLLTIFHYVMAGLTCLLSSFFLFHAFIGWSVMHGTGPFREAAKSAPPPGFGIMFFAVGVLAVCLGWLFGASIAYAGYSIAKRKHYLFCLIIAGLMCGLCNPIGTVLGVCTFVILLRPSVKEIFQQDTVPTE